MKSYKIRPFSRTSYRSTSRCDIVTSQILAGPVKMNEHMQDEHEDIEKKLDIFHILNGVLAKKEI